jgi:hypothetical protein
VTIPRAIAALALLLAAAVLGGCGGEARSGGGTATLWVTRDRGATVLVDERVPAGQTLLRALHSRAEVKTRYGGRFVQSIDGLQGDASRRRDWFWFVNGLTGDTGAGEYRLHDGDVAWWDYRDWSGDAQTLDIVAGAFPEPFLHGFAGKVRPVAVRYAPGRAGDARRVGRAIRATDVAVAGTPVAADAHLFELRAVSGAPALAARLRTPGSGPRAAVRFTYDGEVDQLLDGGYTRRFGP